MFQSWRNYLLIWHRHDGQRSLAWCSPWGHKESDTTEWLNWAEWCRRLDEVVSTDIDRSQLPILCTNQFFPRYHTMSRYWIFKWGLPAKWAGHCAGMGRGWYCELKGLLSPLQLMTLTWKNMGSVSLHLQKALEIHGTYTWDPSALTQPLTETYIEKGWCTARVYSGAENFKVAHSI